MPIRGNLRIFTPDGAPKKELNEILKLKKLKEQLVVNHFLIKETKHQQFLSCSNSAKNFFPGFRAESLDPIERLAG